MASLATRKLLWGSPAVQFFTARLMSSVVLQGKWVFRLATSRLWPTTSTPLGSKATVPSPGETATSSMAKDHGHGPSLSSFMLWAMSSVDEERAWVTRKRPRLLSSTWRWMERTEGKPKLRAATVAAPRPPKRNSSKAMSYSLSVKHPARPTPWRARSSCRRMSRRTMPVDPSLRFVARAMQPRKMASTRLMSCCARKCRSCSNRLILDAAAANLRFKVRPSKLSILCVSLACALAAPICWWL